MAHRFFVPFSLFFRESEFLREADKAVGEGRKGRERRRDGEERGRRLKGRTLGNREDTMRSDEEGGDWREKDRGMEAVTAVEGKYEGMLEKRGEKRTERDDCGEKAEDEDR